MQPAAHPEHPRTLSVLACLFILSYFWLFSYDALHTYFTFDDGMAMLPMHHQFERPLWKNALELIKVFTPAFRPVGAFFYRPLYRWFGFDPFPLRIFAHALMVLNIGLAYVWARNLSVTKEAAALATLLFCYNGSMVDLYYNSATIYDLFCFAFYISAMLVYIRGRSGGEPLTRGRILWVVVLYLLALDSKEMAATLPAALLVYEIVYHPRAWKSRKILLPGAGLLGAMMLASLIFMKVKVANMGQVSGYAPHFSVPFVLTGMANYIQQLLYLPKDSVTWMKGFGLFAGLLAAGALLRSRGAIFGTLFFAVALLPVAVIPARSGYAAYLGYPGLTLAAGAILAGARSTLVRLARRDHLQRVTAVILFLVIATIAARAHAIGRKPGRGDMTWSQPQVEGLMLLLKRTIPEFPPNVRILLIQDPWGPDWGPMFLTRLMYHNPSLWMDRTKNMEKPPNPADYDLLLSYTSPDIDMAPAKFFGLPLPWDIQARVTSEGNLALSPSSPEQIVKTIGFSPPAVQAGHPLKITAAGLANVSIDAVYRIISAGKSKVHTVYGWCTLDENGSCTVPAPHVTQSGYLIIDWIRPEARHWIFTSGVLPIVE